MHDLDMPDLEYQAKVFQRDTFLVLMYAGKPWKILSVT